MTDVRVIVPDNLKIKVLTKLIEFHGSEPNQVCKGEKEGQTLAVFNGVECFEPFVKKAMCWGAVLAGRNR